MLIHVVGQHPDLRMLHQHIGQRLELLARIAGAGGIGRLVEDQPFGLGRDRLFQRFRRQAEAVLQRAFDDHRLAAAQQHDVGIADPIGRGHDHFVAGIQGRQQRVVDDGLAARRDEGLRRLVVEIVLALELGGDGGAQFGNAFHGGVFGLAVVGWP